ncbi:MAG: ABC transporter permease [Burkholderiales bacterium]|nr:ABC transporter permease [Burkholderiales bacterium]
MAIRVRCHAWPRSARSARESKGYSSTQDTGRCGLDQLADGKQEEERNYEKFAERRQMSSLNEGLAKVWETHRFTLISILSVMFVLAVWAFVTMFFTISALIIPSPTVFLAKLKEVFTQGYVGKSMFAHISSSVLRTSAGLLAAIALGIPIGLAAGYNKYISAIITPFTSFLRPIPPIAYIPLVILWFGIGEFSKVSLVFMGAFLYMTLNCSAGVRSVPRDLILVARNLGATERQLFFKVILPASLPFVVTGIKTATAISWSIIVAAELVAAQEGLGYMIMDAATFFRIPEVYVGIMIVGIIGFVLESIVRLLENKTCHWAGK